jgi:hypothetical protein
MANPHPSLQAQTFYPMQCFYVRRQARINRRLRKYRAEKIEAESSFNKQEVLASFYTKTPKHMMSGAADGE